MLIKSYGLKGIIKSKKLSDNKVIVIQDQYERYRKMPINPVTKYKVVALLKIRNPISSLANAFKALTAKKSNKSNGEDVSD